MPLAWLSGSSASTQFHSLTLHVEEKKGVATFCHIYLLEITCFLAIGSQQGYLLNKTPTPSLSVRIKSFCDSFQHALLEAPLSNGMDQMGNQ